MTYGGGRQQESENAIYAHSAAVDLEIAATPEDLFDALDDPTRLGRHMRKPSLMMLGGWMRYRLDEGQGRAIGSGIRMDGRFAFLGLAVDEVVIERRRPFRKVWETRGRPRLLVIGDYRMGFDIAPAGEGSHLHVFIDYDDPGTSLGRFAGSLLGPIYARWCVRRIAEDAADLAKSPKAGI
ncbi:SRPBCC family protein [Ciceribacter thiooxidans]|uniref:SRPBCC family protein n=1 Tax=Ciceribacter thiooxidans TaxID=1969821 RepID=A0ABV7I337_9HYPH|nr:SRPBCC family protein [Ciceribacter thiooxidans]